ncbi:MAG: 4'-phosphopantetheinyl transferase superfamily protein [Planctomycetia bacterium]|nr:4'-phosphopantetheinyl transferase superfamily protein [Planctomycetia bacterium]
MAASEFARGRLAALLSADEQARAARFHFHRDRDRYIVARATLRRLLGEYTGVAPDQLILRYGPHGKPELDHPESGRAIQFNVSHRGEYALYALALRRRVGIDIEPLRAVSEAQRIARSHFTHLESRLICEATEEESRERFFRIWTRKEAVIKAVGTGLSMPLNEFQVTDNPERDTSWQVVRVPSQPDAAWAVCDLTFAERYRAALCVEAGPGELFFGRVQTADLSAFDTLGLRPILA